MNDSTNTRVLVIDDEEMVRDNIEEILMPAVQAQENDTVDMAASILFDTVAQPLLVARKSSNPDFIVDKASNGMEGFEMVKQAMANDKPYAVIFLDMRMPGWDGMETAEQIRKYDTKAEIIFVTAYSDRSIEDIVARAGQNVGYHCKPYASEEIMQLATKAVTDYNKLRNLETLMEAISSISIDENHLNTLLRNILDQLVTYVETDMALLGKMHDDFVYEKIFSIGPIEERINLAELTSRIKATQVGDGEVIQFEDMVLARLDNYSVFAALKKGERLKTEKIYLIKLFVLNAAKAIHNAELREKLLQKEKLSAVGKAMSMMMHDLRSPIKNIRAITQMLREDLPQNEMLDMIDVCAVQASQIFEDFLDFLRETPIKKSPVNIARIVEDAVTTAQAGEDASQVTIRKKVSSSLMVPGDESKLKRTIINLTRNAIDALVNERTKNASVEITADIDAAANEVVMTVHDNGPGIPPEILTRVFEPFVTRKKANGTGLGLAIVKQYMTAHGGSITADNDGGAMFTLRLPLS
ncbi:MAG TPA: ATP-binding protein [Chitinophagaceae bacterium]